MAWETASCFHHSTLLHFSCIWLKLQLEWANREIRCNCLPASQGCKEDRKKAVWTLSLQSSCSQQYTKCLAQSVCMPALQFVCDSCHRQLHLFSCLPGPEKWLKSLWYSLVRWLISIWMVGRTQLAVSPSQNIRPIFVKTSTTHSLFANFTSFCIYYKQRGLKCLSPELSVCIKIFAEPSPPATFPAKGNFLFSHRHYKYNLNIFFFFFFFPFPLPSLAHQVNPT